MNWSFESEAVSKDRIMFSIREYFLFIFPPDVGSMHEEGPRKSDPVDNLNTCSMEDEEKWECRNRMYCPTLEPVLTFNVIPLFLKSNTLLTSDKRNKTITFLSNRENSQVIFPLLDRRGSRTCGNVRE